MTITVAEVKGKVRIAIVDNGRGIAQEDLQYLFDPFFSKKTRGTGLGLANAKKIVEAHGGEIDLRPVATGGTAITIELSPAGPSQDGS